MSAPGGAPPPNASPVSAPPASFTDQKETRIMTLSILTLANAMAAAIPTIESIGADTGVIHNFVAGVIASTEQAYAAAGAGAHKKAAVLAAASAFVTSIGHEWSTVAPHIDSFVEVAVGAYNLAATLVPGLPAVPVPVAVSVLTKVEDEVKAVATVAAPVVTAVENLFGGAKPAPVVTQAVQAPATAAVAPGL